MKTTFLKSLLALAAVTVGYGLLAGSVFENGVLTFDVAEGVSESRDAAFPEGVSKIVKTGPGTLVVSAANATFKGAVEIRNGILEITHKDALGSGNTIEVLSGEDGSGQYRVTLHQKAENGNTGDVQGNIVKIAGSGPDGNGAIYLGGTGRKDDMLGNVTLTGDATIGQWAGGYRGIVGELDLAGHTLTLDGTKHFVLKSKCKVKNMKHIISNTAVLLEDVTYENCSDDATWTKNKVLNVYGISGSLPWQLVHNAGDIYGAANADVYNGSKVGNVFGKTVTLKGNASLSYEFLNYGFLEFSGDVLGEDYNITFGGSQKLMRTVFSGEHSRIKTLTIPYTNITAEVTGRLDAKTVTVKSGTLKVINEGLLYASAAKDSTYTVGNTDSGNTEKSAHLAVGKDSAIDFAPQASGVVTASIRLGDIGTKPAFMEVLEGGTVSNNIYGAVSSPNSKSALHNYGTIYSTSAGGGNDGSFASKGSGYFGLYAGEYKFRDTHFISSDPSATGVVDQKGGRFQWSGETTFGYNGYADYRMSGGIMEGGNLIMCDFSWSFNKYGTVSTRESAGGSTTLTLYGDNCPTVKVASINMCARTNAHVSTINLNAGVLSASIGSTKTSHDDTASADLPRSHFNFNGGVFTAPDNGGFFAKSVPNFVTIFEGGAIFDTSTRAAGVSLCSSTYDPNLKFRAPSGRGIKSIKLPADFDRSGFLGTMPVKITGGGGEGATAILEYDPKTKTAGDVIVTCQGWDYTGAPTVTVKANDFTTEIECEVELTEDNRPMGPIVKIGDGQLNFNCTNLAFNGTFVVSNGTLKILKHTHLPNDVCVKLAGGVFVYDWTGRTFKEIGGHGEIYGYQGQAYHKCTVTEALRFDAKEALKGKFLAFTCGTLDMGDALKVKIDNADALAAATFEDGSPRYFTLMTLAGEKTFSRLPECEGLPDRWRIRLADAGTALQLCRDRGMSIVVR